MTGTRLIVLQLKTHGDIPRLRQVGLVLTRKLDFSRLMQTRIVTALLELGRNTIVHGGGGRMTLALGTHGTALALVAVASDTGPGMDGAGDPGPAPSQGLGLGLAGVERIADSLDIESSSDGTTVTAAFATPQAAADRKPVAVELTEALAEIAPPDPAEALANQNRELMAALEQRDLLLKEVHHRTRNNLTLISSLVRMGARTAKGDEARDMLRDLGLRIAAVSGVHGLLERSETGERVALQQFLTDLAQNIRDAFSTETARVNIDVTGDPVEAEGRLVVDIGLVAGELLTNALKHAFVGRDTGRVNVSVRAGADPQVLVLEVADDGPGLPDGMDRPTRSSSLGWRLVESMAARYDGEIKVTSQDGLRVALSLVDGGWRISGDSLAPA